MFTLYWSADSGAFAVQAALEEAGLPYERVVIDTGKGEQREPDYVALNPMEQVPSLGLTDGTVITESAAMILHIADVVPAANLLPAIGTTERAVAYRWLLLMATGIYEADLRYFYAQRYTVSGDGAEGVKAAALAHMDRVFAIVEAALKPEGYLLGADFSLLDLYLFMLASWYPDRATLFRRSPRLAAHFHRIRARPSVERIWPQHFPAWDRP